MNFIPNSYLNYLSIVPNYRDKKVLASAAQAFIEHNKHIAKSAKNTPVVYMVDFTTKEYLFVHKGCERLTGYDPKYFLRGGLEAFIAKWEAKEFDIYNKKIFPENLKFLTETPVSELSNLIFSHNYSFKSKKGNDINLLQRVSFIEGLDNRIPIGAIGTVTDITHFRNEQSIVHTIEQIRNVNGKEVKEMIHRKTYFKEDSFSLLSKREIEVLKWICEGLGSKQIADKLKLSVNTVHNHRKNMLHKTDCANTFELLNYAVKHKLI